MLSGIGVCVDNVQCVPFQSDLLLKPPAQPAVPAEVKPLRIMPADAGSQKTAQHAAAAIQGGGEGSSCVQ
jgi:hypothetical protein